MKKLLYVTALLLTVYAAAYVLLRAISYIHVIGGVGLGGDGYQVECYWVDGTGKPRFYTTGEAVLYLFRPCWEVECMMRRHHKIHSSANKFTGVNAVGPRQLPMRMRLAAPSLSSGA